jgi:formate dehydrogenase major subunit
MTVSRRTFLKVAGGAFAGTAIAQAAGLGLDVQSAYAFGESAPRKVGRQVPTICPYCAVGCGQIATVDEASGKIIDVQGNADSPVNQGTLCPKGAATFQLIDNPLRETKVKYRAPGSSQWEEKPLDWAMDRIATLFKQTRDANFNETQQVVDGTGQPVSKRVMNTYAIASLGGATMDNEWNYIHQKLMHACGVVYLENQARI